MMDYQLAQNINASQPTCRKCNAPMQRGKAITQTFTGVGDFHDGDSVSTLSAGGPGKLVECMKCPECGWSMSDAKARH